MATQSRWMWCNKCQGLAYADLPPSRCPAGGDHDHEGSGNYILTANIAAQDDQQALWKWCKKCQGLAWSGNRTPGPCAAGGNHDHGGSLDYVLTVNVRAGTTEQSGWMWCNKCQGLAWSGNPTPGRCPAGGDHDHRGSGDYVLTLVAADGYCVPLSAAPGELIDFRVSSPWPYTVTYLRLGIHGDETEPLGKPIEIDANWQSAPELSWQNGCSWDTAFSLEVPADWPSGIYAARCSGDAGVDSYVVFVVRPATVEPGRLAVLASTNTWNAYNNWGGRFKYSDPPGAILSFERPNPYATPIDDDVVPKHRTAAELWVIGWLTDAGYGVDVYSDSDFHAGVADLANYPAVVLNTHPEYWTECMLDRLESYLDTGGSLLYLAGNGLFERVELDLDNNRMIALNGDQNTDRPVCFFRNLDPPRPERALLGVAYREGTRFTFAPYEVRAADHRFFKGTGLSDGDEIGAEGLGGGGASGMEVDTSMPGLAPDGEIVRITSARDDRGEPPPDTVLLARGTNVGLQGRLGADMTTYATRAGGLVFSVGSVSFGGSLVIDETLQTIVRNVLDECLGKG